jgi:hypothetical protein
MRKQYRHPEPPKAGDRIPLVSTRIVEIRDDKPAANQPKHGKLDFLSAAISRVIVNRVPQ